MGTLLVAHGLWGRNAPVGRWGEWVPDRWYWNGSDPTRPALVRLTPLKRAANKAYAANKDNLVGAAAEHPWLGGESTPTHWLATALVLREDSKVRVFGSRPELKKLEPVPADVLRRAHLSESMDQLEETHPTRILYQKLMVSKSDAKRRAKIVGGVGWV
ncbi:MAG: hypothetical protein O2960_30680 [Verrucomicrobia bacterium]|nr:hypothetical protein [Verrucomicrobiota bacterium]